MLFSGLVSWRGTNTGTRGRTSLSVLTRDPKHVGFALVVGVAGRDEQKIREPVDVTECGIADRLGSVERGKIADLVVLQGDLAAEPAAIRRVTTVFKDGVGYDSPRLLATVKGRVGID